MQDVSLRDGAQIRAGTFGSGDGGALIVKVTESLQVIGESVEDLLSSALTTGTTGTGDASDLTIETKYLTVQDGGLISAETQSQGNAGNLMIAASQLTLQNKGEIVVSGQGEFNPGNLTVTADKITLDNQSSIEANTESGSQGNITLNTNNLLTLRRNSEISTNATGTATGGNITINAADGFIVAIPEENSDITANAIQAKGGKVEIDARSIFGIEAREEQTPKSDITATSDLGVQFSGEITINTPDIDPESGLNELPSVPIDADALIAQNLCTLEDGRLAGGSSFVILGRGGLPPSADDPLNNKTRIVDWVSSSSTESSSETSATTEQAETAVSHDLGVESTFPVIPQVRGWAKTKDGKIVLTANAPIAVSELGALAFPNCHTIK